jgi:hypothetical protein
MKRRFAIFLTLLCSASAFAQLAPAPGFQPKSQTAPPPQSATQSPSPAETSAPTTPAATPAATPPAPTPTATTATVAPKANATGGYDLAVPADKQWTDTGINLKAGDKVTINSDGSIVFGGQLAATSEGLKRGWRDLMRALPVNSAGNGALIGRIGAAEIANPFLVGKSKELVAPADGRLFLGINQLANESSTGNYSVKLAVTRAATSSTAATAPQIKLSPDLLKDVPRRVEDQAGNKGDIVNFVVLGSKEKLESAFSEAGWVLVDKSKQGAVINALFSSLDKKAYVQMPMSELFMFGRTQDYGYAHAEPIQVVASRHHLRIWLSPTTYEGRPLYVGACTHDIGFEKDQRNNGVTHKIDPNIDLERDFLKESLTATGNVASTAYLEPTEAVKDAHTATGGDIKTDGRVLVFVLK